mmetsp:Transcript_84099/g.243085  ORF Transcript_84099/g.243085 Transcript_84099/m.243085 type:complete len:214 (-) Transcript_84099:56-697(-)
MHGVRLRMLAKVVPDMLVEEVLGVDFVAVGASAGASHARATAAASARAGAEPEIGVGLPPRRPSDVAATVQVMRKIVGRRRHRPPGLGTTMGSRSHDVVATGSELGLGLGKHGGGAAKVLLIAILGQGGRQALPRHHCRHGRGEAGALENAAEVAQAILEPTVHGVQPDALHVPRRRRFRRPLRWRRFHPRPLTRRVRDRGRMIDQLAVVIVA